MNIKTHKQNLLNKLYEPYKKCMKCPLGSLGRSTIVFGEGNPDAQLMFIGEGPGEQEDKQGRPFVGRSGKLLDTIFAMLNINRNDVFITNIVKCRPPNNRKPYPAESLTCKRLLLEKQINIIQPTIICTLGASSLQGLLNSTDIKMGTLRGTILRYNKYNLLPTYHPAYILRNPKEVQKLIDDIQKAHLIAISKSKNPN